MKKLTNSVSRRTVLKVGGVSAMVLAAPGLSRAQAPTVKIGLLQPMTGGFAGDGVLARYLPEHVSKAH